jgi:hypothetical protein
MGVIVYGLDAPHFTGDVRIERRLLGLAGAAGQQRSSQDRGIYP